MTHNYPDGTIRDVYNLVGLLGYWQMHLRSYAIGTELMVNLLYYAADNGRAGIETLNHEWNYTCE